MEIVGQAGIDAQLEAKSGGYKQIWHHSFFDGENNEIHQGVWIKFFSDEPEG